MAVCGPREIAFMIGPQPHETIAIAEPASGRLVRTIAPGKGRWSTARAKRRSVYGGCALRPTVAMQRSIFNPWRLRPESAVQSWR